MWIEKPTHLRRITTPELDGIAELGEGETAQVTKDVGETLVDNFDAISEHES